MLASSFESLDSDEISSLYALEDAESTHARMSVGVADWLSVAHAIMRHLDAERILNMAREDKVILWKDALGSQHASPDDIPGPLYGALILGRYGIEYIGRWYANRCIPEHCRDWSEQS